MQHHDVDIYDRQLLAQQGIFVLWAALRLDHQKQSDYLARQVITITQILQDENMMSKCNYATKKFSFIELRSDS